MTMVHCFIFLLSSYYVYLEDSKISLSSLLCCFGLACSCTMSDPATSGPDFFAQLSLPPEIALPALWASIKPRSLDEVTQCPPPLTASSSNATLTEAFPFSGKESLSTSAPALCRVLATHQSVFLSSMIGMGNEEVGALLAVVRVRSAPNSTSQLFLLVLGSPVVPWEVVALPRLSLGGHEQLGPYSVACSPNRYPMGFTTHRSTRASTDAGAAVNQLTNGRSDTLLALDGFQALRLMLVTAGEAPSASSPWSPLFSLGAPVLPEGEASRFVSGTEELAVVGMWINFSALPLPPHHGLPLGFVANPASMSSSASFVQALESWSGVTDLRWDWLINPY